MPRCTDLMRKIKTVEKSHKMTTKIIVFGQDFLTILKTFRLTQEIILPEPDLTTTQTECEWPISAGKHLFVKYLAK